MTGSPYHHLVVAYDGSSVSGQALDQAIEMARGWSSSLAILTVYQPPVVWAIGPFPSSTPVIPESPPEGDLRQGVQRAQERGFASVKGALREGRPSEEILRFAEEEHADLIVLGSRGAFDCL